MTSATSRPADAANGGGASARDDLAALVEALDLGVVRFDAAGRGVWINRAGAALLGLPAGAIAGVGWLDLVDPDDHPIARAGYLDMTEQGRAEIEVRARGAGGASFDAVVLMVRALDASGAFAGHHHVVRDVSRERRREAHVAALEAKLAQGGRALAELVSVAAHELGEPVRKVISFGDLLRDSQRDRLDDVGRDYLERIRGAGARMRRLLDDLSALSRVTTSSLPFSPVDLGEAARAAVAELGPAILASGARVEVGELPSIHGDPFQIEQLFTNLVGNALKFARPGEPPVVRITGRVEAGEGVVEPTVEVTVSDDGIGFDPAQAERIFRPFERLHGRGAREGSGLGLAICRTIAERHGGRIEARRAPGQGAAFVVTFPPRRPIAR